MKKKLMVVLSFCLASGVLFAKPLGNNLAEGFAPNSPAWKAANEIIAKDRKQKMKGITITMNEEQSFKGEVFSKGHAITRYYDCSKINTKPHSIPDQDGYCISGLGYGDSGVQIINAEIKKMVVLPCFTLGYGYNEMYMFGILKNNYMSENVAFKNFEESNESYKFTFDIHCDNGNETKLETTFNKTDFFPVEMKATAGSAEETRTYVGVPIIGGNR
ncbi:MAG: hypothetical protein LBG46_07240 [Elusimicrobiota bacterium]|jgi:hypothetical protein|nr:hypothetical protein [Elusimicrobiota bacterium]